MWRYMEKNTSHDKSQEGINEAPLSMPVEILGMNDSAFASAEFMVTRVKKRQKNYQILKKILRLRVKYQLRIKLLYLTM